MAKESAAPSGVEFETVTPVINNEARLTHIQLPGKPGKGGDVRPGPLIKLVPGLTLVDTELWEQAKKNPAVQKLLAEKVGATVAPEGPPPERVGQPKLVEWTPMPKDKPLLSISEKESMVLVGEMCDLEVITRTEVYETRSNTLAALRKAREAIEKPRLRRKAG